jgi:GcrA cell cycle regulator
MSWTDERVELLKKLWGEGHTAAEIAKKLGQVTRNAVIGKAHRLKLPSRVSPIKSGQKKKIKAANSNVKAKAANTSSKNKSNKTKASVKMPPTLPKSDTTIGDKVPLVDLKASQCRWPNGDPQKDDFGFCARKVMEGLPYCQEHAQIGYQAATRNRILKSAKMLKDIESAAAKKKVAK